MWSCPAEGRAVRGPPGKLRIWVTWRGRDRCPSPIDLWVQGMTTCFLVPSLPSMSARERACVRVCVCVAGNGEEAGIPRQRRQLSTRLCAPSLCQQHPNAPIWVLHPDVATQAPHSPWASLEYGADTVYCLLTSHFLFQPPSFLLTEP